MSAALSIPGSVPGTRISFDEYRAIRAVNWSRLKHMATSPLHYVWSLKQPDEDSTSRAIGRATHTAIFEPELFDELYVEWADGDRRGNAWKEFKAAHADKTILKTAELERARACGEAVRNHPLVRPYLEMGGEFERTLLWKDEPTGLPCKARVDWLAPGVLLDLKTARTINKRLFGKQAGAMGYPCQLAHYRAGCIANGLEINEVAIVAVENAGPFDVGVFYLNEDDLAYGEDTVRDLLDKLAECGRTRQFPGQYQTKERIDLPAYLWEDAEEVATDGLNFNVSED